MQSERKLQVLLLVLMVAIAITWCEVELKNSTTTFNSPSVGSEIPKENRTAFLENLSSQVRQRNSWAYATLAGLFALSVTKQKVLPIPGLRLAYLLVAISSVFLVESLHAADLYDRRVAFLLIHGKFTAGDVGGLSAVLMNQLTFLYSAIASLGVFVVTFVSAIVTGTVSPHDKEDSP